MSFDERAEFQRSVVVAEDDAFLRSLLAESLDKAGFLVSTAATIADAKRAVKAMDPDAIVLDIDFGPGPNGFDLAESLRKSHTGLAIVFLTSQPDPRFSSRDETSIPKNEAYLNKHLLADTSTLVDALEAVLTGGQVGEFRHHELVERPLQNLSNSQIQVLKLLAEGQTNQQIANTRKRSLSATESLVTRTLEALGLQGETDQNIRVAAAIKYAQLVAPPAKS